MTRCNIERERQITHRKTGSPNSSYSDLYIRGYSPWSPDKTTKRKVSMFDKWTFYHVRKIYFRSKLFRKWNIKKGFRVSVGLLQNFLKTHFSRTEWDIYNEWTDYVFENSPELKLDGIIYLRADPSVCAERMRKRGRLDESGVTLEYLKGTGFIFETCSTAPPFYKPGRRNSWSSWRMASR